MKQFEPDGTELRLSEQTAITQRMAEKHLRNVERRKLRREGVRRRQLTHVQIARCTDLELWTVVNPDCSVHLDMQRKPTGGYGLHIIFAKTEDDQEWALVWGDYDFETHTIVPPSNMAAKDVPLTEIPAPDAVREAVEQYMQELAA